MAGPKFLQKPMYNYYNGYMVNNNNITIDYNMYVQERLKIANLNVFFVSVGFCLKCYKMREGPVTENSREERYLLNIEYKLVSSAPTQKYPRVFHARSNRNPRCVYA